MGKLKLPSGHVTLRPSSSAAPLPQRDGVPSTPTGAPKEQQGSVAALSLMTLPETGCVGQPSDGNKG